jgi:hypothetical protein
MIILEAKKEETNDVIEFINTRKKGAQKILTEAKAKGGYSKLTAEHFQGKVDAYQECLDMIHKKANIKDVDDKFHYWKEKISSKSSTQKIFQVAIGKAEVFGEVALFLRGKHI